jgi:hypothetical protein
MDPGGPPIFPIGSGASVLTPDEFESLTKAVQLLRISQLRYIVQKFSLPANGNKTKLLSILLSIFQSLRYDRRLLQIHHEVSKLMAQFDDAFASPIAPLQQLEVAEYNPAFVAPPNPLVEEFEGFLFGPLYAPIGQFTGQFQFTCPERVENAVMISFLFPGGLAHQFGLKIELNHFPFEIVQEDPFPQPLDITHVLNPASVQILDVKAVVTAAPMMICIRQYRFMGIQGLADRICGRGVTLQAEHVPVQSPACAHVFDLVSLLSVGLATGHMCCPTCQTPLDIGSLRMSTPQPPETRPQDGADFDPFQAPARDLFPQQLNWFDF